MKITKEQKAQRAAKRARLREKKQAIKPTPADELKLDLYLTFIIVLQEVMMRYVFLCMDNPAVVYKLKEKMKKFIHAGNELNDVFRGFVRADPYSEDPEELMDVEADRLFELVNATSTMASDEQWLKAISMVKNISGFPDSSNN